MYWNTDLADWTDFRGRWAVGTQIEQIEQIEQIFADLSSKNTTIWAKNKDFGLINGSEADSFCIFLVLLWAWFVFLMGSTGGLAMRRAAEGRTRVATTTSEAKCSSYTGMSEPVA